jgi:hypothetical protein
MTETFLTLYQLITGLCHCKVNTILTLMQQSHFEMLSQFQDNELSAQPHFESNGIPSTVFFCWFIYTLNVDASTLVS